MRTWTWTTRVVALGLGLLLLGGGVLAVSAMRSSTQGHGLRAAFQASPAAGNGCTEEGQHQNQSQNQGQGQNPAAAGTPQTGGLGQAGTGTPQAQHQDGEQPDDQGTPAAGQSGQSGQSGTAQADQPDRQCASATPGTLGTGTELLPQAKITVDQAVKAAQAKASGPLGEVSLEKINGRLVFTVRVGDTEVLVDATDGSIVSANSGDEGD